METFDMLDGDRDRALSVKELNLLLDSLTDVEIESFIKEFDNDGDGKFSTEEYSTAISSGTNGDEDSGKGNNNVPIDSELQ